jgi:molybdenum cofactor biosynthesis enzyme MoaA
MQQPLRLLRLVAEHGRGRSDASRISDFSRSLSGLGTRVVAFSGRPLLRPDVFAVADLFLERSLKLELLTSGVLLARHAGEVASRFTRVTLSLDATTSDLYKKVRGIEALAAVESGIARLRRRRPRFPLPPARRYKANFRELPRLVRRAASSD